MKRGGIKNPKKREYERKRKFYPRKTVILSNVCVFIQVKFEKIKIKERGGGIYVYV